MTDLLKESLEVVKAHCNATNTSYRIDPDTKPCEWCTEPCENGLRFCEPCNTSGVPERMRAIRREATHAAEARWVAAMHLVQRILVPPHAGPDDPVRRALSALSSEANRR